MPDFSVYSWHDVEACAVVPAGVKTALTVGVFDGPHIGHARLIDSVLDFCHVHKGVRSGVVTFNDMNFSTKKINSATAAVSSMNQRLDFFKKKGIDFVIIIDFSVDFSKIEGQTFISRLIKNCGMTFLCEGDDFRCGYKGSCDVREITALSRTFSFELAVKESVIYKGLKVSSSRIRSDVREARFDDVRVMLDRPYSIDCASGAETSAQVLPKAGTYPVIIVAGEKRLKSELTVSESKIVSYGIENQPVTEIIFM